VCGVPDDILQDMLYISIASMSLQVLVDKRLFDLPL